MAHNLDVLPAAGVTFVDIRTDRAGPAAIQSGTGGDVIAGFDLTQTAAVVPDEGVAVAREDHGHIQLLGALDVTIRHFHGRETCG
ncbi:MAG: hypothetical protein ACRDSG_07910 [Pseudonocardiaceae bacterium]